MDNSLNIKVLKKVYYVTLDDKPVCDSFTDEPRMADSWRGIYDAFVIAFGRERVKVVCITTFDVLENVED